MKPRYLLVVAFAVSFCVPTPAGAQQAPNRTDVVAAVARQFPVDFMAADTDAPNGDTFIRRLAWTLHQQDARFGLNGKCGSDNVSKDAIAYAGAVIIDGFRVDVQAFDVIGGAGGPNPQAAWQEITKPIELGGCGSKWIQPTDPGGSVVVPPPAAPSCASCEREVSALKVANAQLLDAVEVKDRRLVELEAQITALQTGVGQMEQERNAAREEAETSKAALANVRCEGQRVWGFKTSCRVIR